jgi:hypothetical protein
MSPRLRFFSFLPLLKAGLFASESCVASTCDSDFAEGSVPLDVLICVLFIVQIPTEANHAQSARLLPKRAGCKTNKPLGPLKSRIPQLVDMPMLEKRISPEGELGMVKELHDHCGLFFCAQCGTA